MLQLPARRAVSVPVRYTNVETLVELPDPEKVRELEALQQASEAAANAKAAARTKAEAARAAMRRPAFTATATTVAANVKKKENEDKARGGGKLFRGQQQTPVLQYEQKYGADAVRERFRVEPIEVRRPAGKAGSDDEKEDKMYGRTDAEAKAERVDDFIKRHACHLSDTESTLPPEDLRPRELTVEELLECIWRVYDTLMRRTWKGPLTIRRVVDDIVDEDETFPSAETLIQACRVHRDHPTRKRRIYPVALLLGALPLWEHVNEASISGLSTVFCGMMRQMIAWHVVAETRPLQEVLVPFVTPSGETLPKALETYFEGALLLGNIRDIQRETLASVFVQSDAAGEVGYFVDLDWFLCKMVHVIVRSSAPDYKRRKLEEEDNSATGGGEEDAKPIYFGKMLSFDGGVAAAQKADEDKAQPNEDGTMELVALNIKDPVTLPLPRSLHDHFPGFTQVAVDIMPKQPEDARLPPPDTSGGAEDDGGAPASPEERQSDVSDDEADDGDEEDDKEHDNAGGASEGTFDDESLTSSAAEGEAHGIKDAADSVTGSDAASQTGSQAASQHRVGLGRADRVYPNSYAQIGFMIPRTQAFPSAEPFTAPLQARSSSLVKIQGPGSNTQKLSGTGVDPAHRTTPGGGEDSMEFGSDDPAMASMIAMGSRVSDVKFSKSDLVYPHERPLPPDNRYGGTRGGADNSKTAKRTGGTSGSVGGGTGAGTGAGGDKQGHSGEKGDGSSSKYKRSRPPTSVPGHSSSFFEDNRHISAPHVSAAAIVSSPLRAAPRAASAPGGLRTDGGLRTIGSPAGKGISGPLPALPEERTAGTSESRPETSRASSPIAHTVDNAREKQADTTGGDDDDVDRAPAHYILEELLTDDPAHSRELPPRLDAACRRSETRESPAYPPAASALLPALSKGAMPSAPLLTKDEFDDAHALLCGQAVSPEQLRTLHRRQQQFAVASPANHQVFASRGGGLSEEVSQLTAGLGFQVSLDKDSAPNLSEASGVDAEAVEGGSGPEQNSPTAQLLREAYLSSRPWDDAPNELIAMTKSLTQAAGSSVLSPLEVRRRAEGPVARLRQTFKELGVRQWLTADIVKTGFDPRRLHHLQAFAHEIHNRPRTKEELERFHEIQAELQQERRQQMQQAAAAASNLTTRQILGKRALELERQLNGEVSGQEDANGDVDAANGDQSLTGGSAGVSGEAADKDMSRRSTDRRSSIAARHRSRLADGPASGSSRGTLDAESSSDESDIGNSLLEDDGDDPDAMQGMEDETFRKKQKQLQATMGKYQRQRRNSQKYQTLLQQLQQGQQQYRYADATPNLEDTPIADVPLQFRPVLSALKAWDTTRDAAERQQMRSSLGVQGIVSQSKRMSRRMSLRGRQQSQIGMQPALLRNSKTGEEQCFEEVRAGMLQRFWKERRISVVCHVPGGKRTIVRIDRSATLAELTVAYLYKIGALVMPVPDIAAHEEHLLSNHGSGATGSGKSGGRNRNAHKGSESKTPRVGGSGDAGGASSHATPRPLSPRATEDSGSGASSASKRNSSMQSVVRSADTVISAIAEMKALRQARLHRMAQVRGHQQRFGVDSRTGRRLHVAGSSAAAERQQQRGHGSGRSEEGSSAGASAAASGASRDPGSKSGVSTVRASMRASMSSAAGDDDWIPLPMKPTYATKGSQFISQRSVRAMLSPSVTHEERLLDAGVRLAQDGAVASTLVPLPEAKVHRDMENLVQREKAHAEHKNRVSRMRTNLERYGTTTAPTVVRASTNATGDANAGNASNAEGEGAPKREKVPHAPLKFASGQLVSTQELLHEARGFVVLRAGRPVAMTQTLNAAGIVDNTTVEIMDRALWESLNPVMVRRLEEEARERARLAKLAEEERLRKLRQERERLIRLQKAEAARKRAEAIERRKQQQLAKKKAKEGK